jgi:methylenetetrahydrofolate reductase (NADPH)
MGFTGTKADWRRRMMRVFSELMKKVSEGIFVVTGEIEPVKTTDLKPVLEKASLLKRHVTAINVTDNPTAFAYLNTLITCYFMQEKTGVEAVYQITVRDRNRLAILSDLLAAGTLNIRNVLALSGDFVSVGDNPQAKPVYDLDSTQLLYFARKIVDEGMDLAGNKIDNPPKFNVGIAGNPNADPLEPELYKILRKQNIGADFIQTQCVYNLESLDRFLEGLKSLGVKVPILVGVAPFKSVKMMNWMINYVPGINVPKDMKHRLEEAGMKSKEAFREESKKVFAEICSQIKKKSGVCGIHMMALGFEEVVPDILLEAGI